VCVYYCSTYYKAVEDVSVFILQGCECAFVTAVPVRVGRRIVEDMCYETRTTSRGLCGLVCPSRTSERGGEGDCVKESRGRRRGA